MQFADLRLLSGDVYVKYISLAESYQGTEDINIDIRDVGIENIRDDLDGVRRIKGTYEAQNIWIEMRPYSASSDAESERIIPPVKLLRKLRKMVQFCTPYCLGYVDDKRNHYHGIVFAKPEHVASFETPTTLRTLLDEKMPPLGD